MSLQAWGRRHIRRVARRGYWWVYGQARDAPEDALATWAKRDPERVKIGHRAGISAAVIGAGAPLPAGSCIEIGDDTTIVGRIYVRRPSLTVRVGARCAVWGGMIEAAAGIWIGNDVLIAEELHLRDHDSHSTSWDVRQYDYKLPSEKVNWDEIARVPVRIEDKVWIGARVIILKGVTIGEGAIVGAGRVVTKNVPPWTIVAGNPARVVRELMPEERSNE